MKKNEPLANNHIHRFELIPNTTSYGIEKMFSLFGILISPILLSSVLMYNVFTLRATYFWMSMTLLIIILLNVYMFYRMMIERNNKLQLIITGDYFQILNSKQVYLQEQMNTMNIYALNCGKPFYSAIKISNEGFEGIIIGVKDRKDVFQETTAHQLTQPDYWLRRTNDWEVLSQLLVKE